MSDSNYTVTVSRLELCDLMLACTNIICDARQEMTSDPSCPAYRRDVVLPDTIKKWQALHDKLERQLDMLDAGNIFAELLDEYKNGSMSKDELKAEMGRRAAFLI